MNRHWERPSARGRRVVTNVREGEKNDPAADHMLGPGHHARECAPFKCQKVMLFSGGRGQGPAALKAKGRADIRNDPCQQVAGRIFRQIDRRFVHASQYGVVYGEMDKFL